MASETSALEQFACLAARQSEIRELLIRRTVACR